MHIIAVGLNHRMAPVELREQLAFPAEARELALARLREVQGVRESVLLSTCNRTELYAVVDDLHPGFRQLIDFLADERQVAVDTFAERLYRLQGTGAVRHLFAVTSGIDSMMLGETQILGQVKDAYRAAHAHGAVGQVLHALFQRAIRTGKRAHTETEIGENTTSIGHAAVRLVQTIFPDLARRSVLLVGAGKMGRATARYLADVGVREIQVANRTEEHARRLVAECGGSALPLEAIAASLADVDVVITSTDSAAPLIYARAVRRALAQRPDRPLFFVDIAVPRDVDPEVEGIDGAHLYDVDDLEAVVDANLRERRREQRKVELIIDDELAKFEAWLRRLDVAPLIKSLRQRLDEIRGEELDRAFGELPQLSGQERQVIEKLTAVIVNKILNEPTLRLKELAENEEAEAYLAALMELFALDDPSDGEAVERLEADGDASPERQVAGPRAQAQ